MSALASWRLIFVSITLPYRKVCSLAAVVLQHRCRRSAMLL
jgi:hypothetical protein